MKVIDPKAKEVLSSAVIEGNSLRLIGTLDRKVYQDVNLILEEIGGKWNRKLKAHVFESNPETRLNAILEAGKFTQAKQEFGAFFTPPELANRLIGYADIRKGCSVLEPSAGSGNLATLAAGEAGLDNVQCVELQPSNVAILRSKGFKVIEADFLTLNDFPPFDRIVMNPPFAKQADIEHVTHALKFLAPAGRLVAIMSAGIEFRSNKKTKEFLDLIGTTPFEYGIDRNPEQAFAESGTNVNTVMVCIEREC